MAIETSTASYGGKITSYVVLSCMVAATGGLLFGYDLGISGGVTSMEPFLNKFFPEVLREMQNSGRGGSNYCLFDSERLTAFTSSLYLAGMAATLVATPITRAYGRRASMLAGGASFLAGAAIGGIAANVGMLITGRVLLGVGIGFTNQAVPLYLSEMAPPNYRGALNNTFEVCVGLGVFAANLINYGTEKLHSNLGWRLSLLLAAVPATFLTIGTIFLPETPNSIIQRKNNIEKATILLQKIRGTPNVQDELNDIVAASKASESVHYSFRIVMQKKYRPQLVMSVLIAFFQQATGINVITFYAPILFRMIGLGESWSLLSTVLTSLISTCSVFIAIVLVDRLGRRALFTIGGVPMLVTHVAVGAVLATQLGDHGGIKPLYADRVLFMICVYVAGFGISWGPLGWLLPSEILPLEIRSVGQGIVVAVGFLLAFVLAQTMLALLCHLKSGVFFLFAGWVLLMTVFVLVFLPETKGLPIEKVDRAWSEHWFWKNVVRGDTV